MHSMLRQLECEGISKILTNFLTAADAVFLR